MNKHRVVIVGAGFGGLNAAKGLKRADADVTVIDRRNFHLFQPLLYQVATGSLSPGEIAEPIRVVLHRNINTRVIMAEVSSVDASAKTLILDDGKSVPYDTLVVATGAADNYFAHPEWAQFAPGLKTVENALEIRSRIFLAFEAAERELDPEARKAWLTFVIIGGGPTGVEMSGAIADIARDTLHRDFRTISEKDVNVTLIEGTGRLLTAYPEDLAQNAEEKLKKMGVMTRAHSMVTTIDEQGVEFKHDDKSERIDSKTVIWAAGVKASALGKIVAYQTGAEADKMGRVVVESDCTVKGHPEIFVIGDLASFSHDGGKPLPGVAQVGIQMGSYVAKVISARLDTKHPTPPKPFHYWDKGNMATIGRAAAIAQIGKLHVTGFIAWIMWLFIHLMYLVSYQSRLVVILQWFYSYATFNRGARLITINSEKPVVPS